MTEILTKLTNAIKLGEKFFIGDNLRSSTRGLVMRENCFGCRFTTRSSTRPQREGLTTHTVRSPSSIPINPRTVSTNPARSISTPCRSSD